jgi:hypothetical protein
MLREDVLQTLRLHFDEVRSHYGVKSLRLFGSVARDSASEGSDVDLLVAFDGPPTFRDYMDLRIYLEDLLNCQVDLITETGLRERVRPFVEKDAIRVA